MSPRRLRENAVHRTRILAGTRRNASRGSRFERKSQEIALGPVFISYRREDTQGQARALFQDLVAKLGRDAVFMDVDSIALGKDFREVLQERLATSGLMLVLIGPDWLEGKDKSGRRRIDNPADFVRLEIAAALKRNIPITPVLLQGAQMPGAEQLPADLAPLAYRNGFELSHNRWDSDVKELIRRLGLNGPDGASAADGPKPAVPRWTLVVAAATVALAVAGGFLYRTMQEAAPTVSTAGGAANRPASTVETKSPDSPLSKADQSSEVRHDFDPAQFRLTIDDVGSYKPSPFAIAGLDPEKDFRLQFHLRSTRAGGSTRYGIAWNYSSDDFMLFTLHSVGGGYYTIGPGKSRSLQPFARLSEGPLDIHGQSDYDALEMTKIGGTLSFAINGREVWRTDELRLRSNQFAFWVADHSEALLKSYTMRQ